MSSVSRRSILLIFLCIVSWLITLWVLSVTIMGTMGEVYAKAVTDLFPFTKKVVLLLNYSNAYMVATIVLSVMASVGAFLLWKRYRIGFYLFTISQVGSIVAPFLVLNKLFSFTYVFKTIYPMIIFAAVLILLFALTLPGIGRYRKAQKNG